MRLAGLFVLCLGAVTALAGVAMAVAAFAPIPFTDSLDFIHQFMNAGGWEGYGPSELYAPHNEHRLVVPRLWFFLDMAAFDATQASLIAVIVLSSVAHALVLALVFRSLGHRGWGFWMFAGAALGAVLSPAQWENLVWGFQVQFVQVWLFATLAFVAVAHATGRCAWWLVLAGLCAALASTYSMANGLLVWPLLIALALWAGVRGGPLALLLAVAVAVVAVEAVGFRAHPGHGDPLQTIAEPVTLFRYAFRYLTNAIGAIGSRGRELLGVILFLTVVATAAGAIARRHRYSPAHGILLAVAGFVIGAALLTALGRVTFGLGQANAIRYATPSLIFLLAVGALLLDRLLRVGNPHLRAGGAMAGAALLLVPGLVAGYRHLPTALAERDARVNAVVAYLAGGYRPATLQALFPFPPSRPFLILRRFEEEGWGPFARRDRFMPPAALLETRLDRPSETCRGHVDSAVADPVTGVEVTGWAADTRSAEQPAWILVTDGDGKVVGWGASRVRRDDVGRALGIGWRGRGFLATGSGPAAGALAVLAAFADGRTCLVEAGVVPRPPLFLAALPEPARPAADVPWTVVEGSGTDRTGPQPVPAAVEPAIGTLGENSRLVARIDLAPPGVRAALAVPVRTGPYPTATVLLVRDAETGAEVERHVFERPSQDGWVWRVFARSADPRFKGHTLRVEATTAGPQPEVGMAVGRPHWIPVADGGTGAGMSLHLDGPARDGDR